MADFRRWVLAFAALVLLLGLAAPARAQNGLACTAVAAVTPTLRHEGFTELTGDILLTCVGTPGSAPTPPGAEIPQVQVTVNISAPVTSRILGGASPLLNDALLLVDDPSPANQDPCLNPLNPTLCQVMGDGGQSFNNPGKFNVFQGIGGGPGSYSVTFSGVPLDPPAASARTYRITNIRVDATTALAGGDGLTPVYAFVSSSANTSMQINNPQVTVGFAVLGLNTETSVANPTLYQCDATARTTVGTVTFTENFATAFKVRTDGAQNVPGVVYFSESGLQINISNGTAGTADTGTRLQTVISNIPSGVSVWVDNWASSTAATPGYPSDATLATGSSSPSDPGFGTITQITNGTESSATVVWEVTNTNSDAIDSISFNIYVSFGAGSTTPNITATTLSGFSPELAAYSSSGPIPEFSNSVNIALSPTNLFTISPCTAITSSPSGAAITVAGSGCAAGGYITPANPIWSAGAVCTITFTDPQTIGGVEYEFQSSTVNGSAISHSNPLTVDFGGSSVSINAAFSAVSGTGPGTATHFSVTAPANATAGIPVQFTVTALNSSNQTVAAYSDPVHFTSTDSSATLPGDATLTNGMGTFSASLVTPGAVTLTANDLLSPSITGTSGTIEVAQSTSGLHFISMPPCRVVDTRDTTKPSGFGPPSLAGGATRSFSIPNGACGVPATAQAYSLNVTVVPDGPLAYLTTWPTGQSQPVVSTLNSLDGEVKANAAIVAGGTGGAINLLATNATDVVLDINGYFVPNTVSNGLGFYPMTPCRLVDTRPGAPSTIITGALNGGTSTTLPILSSSCNVPATAQAYSLNFTLVPPGPVAYLTVFPTGEGLPIVSTLNDPTGSVEANAAIAPAGTGGSIEAFVTQTTDLVVDINGYFAPVGNGALSLYALPPCRVLDTRIPAGAPPFVGAINVNVIGGGCGGTSAAQAYVFNATVVPDGPLGYLTLWPHGNVQPVVSTLNAIDGAITSNMALVPTSNTEISAFAANSTYLVLDIFGYFAP